MKRFKWLALLAAPVAATFGVSSIAYAVPVNINASSVAGIAAAAVSGLSQNPNILDSTPCVKQLTLTKVDAMRSDGQMQAAESADGLARVYHFQGSQGDDVFEIVPPPNWRPLTATDHELKIYGFPPRPTDAAALKRWNDHMARWKKVGTPGMCETNVRNSLHATASSPIWAGGMSVNGSASVSTFYESDGEYLVPTFIGTCPNPSAYSLWSGLGGWNQIKLLQAGITADPGNTQSSNQSFEWWEALDVTHNNPSVAFTGDVVNAGDDVESFVSYDSATNTADMAVYDFTSGVSGDSHFTSYKNESALKYYDGTTSDFIAEQVTNSSTGALYSLRQPKSPVSYFFALTNGQPIANFGSWRINQVDSSGLAVNTSSFDGADRWTDTWHGCS